MFHFPYLCVALTSFLLLPHFWCVIKNWSFITFDLSQNTMDQNVYSPFMFKINPITAFNIMFDAFASIFSKIVFIWFKSSWMYFSSHFNIFIDIISMLHSLNEVFTLMLNDYKIFIENNWDWVFWGLKKNDLVFQFLF